MSAGQNACPQVLDSVPQHLPRIFWEDWQLEECWQFQRLVKVIEYFTTSLDCFGISHCFWREPGGILCTFISEGRMFSMLERLDPTSHKGEDHMITSDSFVLEIGNNMKNVLDLFATKSRT